MAKSLAALIVDADVQSRYEMKQLVRSSGFDVAAECGYGVEATSRAAELQPDVVLVAVDDPVERALQTLTLLVTLLPETLVLTYSNTASLDVARQTMLAGARDFLPRPLKTLDLQQSVMKAMDIEEQRRMSRMGNGAAPATRGTVVAISGAKGGIGKSTVATNLAVALGRQRAGSVCLVDLDTGFGDVAGMLNIKPERTIKDLVANQAALERDDVLRYMSRLEAGDLDVLAGAAPLQWRDISADDTRRIVGLLARHYDMIVLDTSGVLDAFTEMAIELSTIVLWITTTEFASVNDTIAAMRALRELSMPDCRIRLIVNAVSADDYEKPDVLAEILGRKVFWSIPYDNKVRRGAYVGEPVVVSQPSSVAAKSFCELARVIAGGRGAAPKKPAKGFRWLPGMQPAAAAGG